MSEHNNNRRADMASAPTKTSEPEYKVGPGRPPKEHQFKPGQSGNPKGAKRKPKPMVPDLKAALERALNELIKLKQAERERTMTMAEAGIKQMVAQFVKGNHQARREPDRALRQGWHRSDGGPATSPPGGRCRKP